TESLSDIGFYALIPCTPPPTAREISAKQGESDHPDWVGYLPDWVVARMGVMEFLASGLGDTALQNDQTVLRGIQHIDAGPRHEASFVMCDQLIVG
ncbi:MAG TPA: hypothetical protein VLM40_19245, partial [Gemmata sp.]|nr:hypothetical protein [Gemmata sp.]